MSKSRQRRVAEPPAAKVEPQPVVPRRIALLVSLSVFLILAFVYHATVLRTVVDIDSGELVAAVHVQGIPHPTGYPLWLLLGRLFDYLPLGGTSAYRVGMMCGVGVAAAGAVISLAALSLTGEALLALAAGLSFGLWTPPWADSARAMVHAITGLFVAIAILALRRWNRERSTSALLWLSLAAGFAAMHHRTAFLVLAPAFLAAFALTPPRCRGRYYALGWLAFAGLAVSTISHVGMVVMVAAVVVMIAYAAARQTCLRAHLAAVGLFLAPFSLYFYLWRRALAQPAVNWTDPTTLDRLIYHVFAKQYFGFALQNSAAQMLDYAAKLVPDVLSANLGLALVLGVIGGPLIIWGWGTWWRREPVVAGSLAAGSALLCFWVLKWGEASDLKHFLAPIGPVLALSGAIGLAQVGSLRPLGRVARVAPALVGLLLCATLAEANWQRCDFSGRWANRDRWAAALKQMDPNAVFISDFDQPTFVTLYLQNVERLRQDVTLIRTTRLPAPEQPDQWYLNLMKDTELREAVRETWPRALVSAPQIHEQTAAFAYLLAQHLPHRPVYVVHGPMRGPIPGPPYFVGLSEDLVRLEPEQPGKPLPDGGRKELAVFPWPGLALTQFELDRAAAGEGELVRFTADWRLDGPLQQAQFGIALLPPGVDVGAATAVTDTDKRWVQGFPIAYGSWGLSPSPKGTAYEQKGWFIVPSNAAAGRGVAITARVFVGIAPLYSTSYEGWVEVGQLSIDPRSLPRNGP